jgi:hypothetical protein
MSRDPIDLKKLPIWMQYTIALSLTAIVVFVAWMVGGDKPVPVWLTKYFIPALGWLYIVLFSCLIISRLFKQKSK